MVMIHTHAKDQGQRSVRSKDRKEPDGRMEAIAISPVVTQSVNITDKNYVIS